MVSQRFWGPGGTHGLAHGVDLRDLTSTLHADADVDGGELIDTEKEDGLVELGPENLGGEELDGGAVHPDEALAGHHARDGCKQIGSAPQFRRSRGSRERGNAYRWHSSSCQRPGLLVLVSTPW